MVTGTEEVFEDVYEARDYVLALEREELERDVMRGEAFSSMPECLMHPNVSYCNGAHESKFIMRLVYSRELGLFRYSLRPNLKNRKYLFRGETQFHDPCKPGLFRDTDRPSFLDSLIYGDEMFRLILSHPLVQLLDMGVSLGGCHVPFAMNLYGLTQHYYNETSLLDLTSDIDVALFFATQNYDRNKDAYSPLIDEMHEPGVLYYYSLDCWNAFRSPDGLGLSDIGLQVFPRSGRQKGFLYACEENTDFNLLPQLRAVRFKHKESIANEIYTKMDGGRRLFPRDILWDHWEGVKEKGRVSLDAVCINVARKKGENVESIQKKLNRCGIEVADYKPMLTEDELHRYYEAVRKENFWETFCDQIYIPGDGDGRMMEDLLNVPKNPEYEWAFREDLPSRVNYDQGPLLKYYKEVLMRE